MPRSAAGLHLMAGAIIVPLRLAALRGSGIASVRPPDGRTQPPMLRAARRRAASGRCTRTTRPRRRATRTSARRGTSAWRTPRAGAQPAAGRTRLGGPAAGPGRGGVDTVGRGPHPPQERLWDAEALCRGSRPGMAVRQPVGCQRVQRSCSSGTYSRWTVLGDGGAAPCPGHDAHVQRQGGGAEGGGARGLAAALTWSARSAWSACWERAGASSGCWTRATTHSACPASAAGAPRPSAAPPATRCAAAAPWGPQRRLYARTRRRAAWPSARLPTARCSILTAGAHCSSLSSLQGEASGVARDLYGLCCNAYSTAVVLLAMPLAPPQGKRAPGMLRKARHAGGRSPRPPVLLRRSGARSPGASRLCQPGPAAALPGARAALTRARARAPAPGRALLPAVPAAVLVRDAVRDLAEHARGQGGHDRGVQGQAGHHRLPHVRVRRWHLPARHQLLLPPRLPGRAPGGARARPRRPARPGLPAPLGVFPGPPPPPPRRAPSMGRRAFKKKVPAVWSLSVSS